jgi:hypothetical protein
MSIQAAWYASPNLQMNDFIERAHRGGISRRPYGTEALVEL